MPKELTIAVNDDGSLTFIDDPRLASLKLLGEVETKRASHVEPNNGLLRVAFHLLRRVFGETGRVSNFTRHWPCVWRVNMAPSDGPILDGRWLNRQEALNAEVAWLNNHLFASEENHD